MAKSPTFTVMLALTDEGVQCLEDVFAVFRKYGSLPDNSHLSPAELASMLNLTPVRWRSQEAHVNVWHALGMPMDLAYRLYMDVITGVLRFMPSDMYVLVLNDETRDTDGMWVLGYEPLLKLCAALYEEHPEPENSDDAYAFALTDDEQKLLDEIKAANAKENT